MAYKKCFLIYSDLPDICITAPESGVLKVKKNVKEQSFHRFLQRTYTVTLKQGILKILKITVFQSESSVCIYL